MKHFHLGRRANFPIIFLAVAFLTNAAFFAFSKPVWDGSILQSKSGLELAVAAVGIAAAFVHFLYTQHHQDTQIFVAQFEKFNARYNGLNERLNAIVSRPKESPLLSEQRDTLYDYFNLCAEEYLFYESGYIDERVWRAWLLGMKYFAQDEVLRRLWKEELASGSYYHFTLSLLDAVEFPANFE